MGEVITIDGLASSGKSTLGKIFATRINYQFVDVGLIYRAGSYYLLSHLISTDDPVVPEIFSKMNIQFIPGISRDQVFAFGQDVTDWLHIPDVSRLVPKVAAISKVQKEVHQIQRVISLSGNFVFAGREEGSVVFPDAKLKFVIIATLKKRGERRYYQLKKSDPDVQYESVLEDLKKRDYQDIHRRSAPFKRPKGAFVIDTTDLTIEESVSKMEKVYEERFLKRDVPSEDMHL